MKIGILGSGLVAQTLAAGCLRHKHQVLLGTRTPAKLSEWQAQHPGVELGSFSQAASFGDLVILAVKGNAAASALTMTDPNLLAGKIILDATNPIADAPPVNGVLKFFTSLDKSLMETLQQDFPAAKFVKAFSCVGAHLMVNPELPEGKPTMFICGNDAGAKDKAKQLLHEFGWNVADMGKAEAARAIEPLCMLWCIPGFLNNDWNHAFKMLQG